MNLKKKNLKKMIAPLVSIIVLVLASIFGLSDEIQLQLETTLITIITAILGLLAAFGVVENNDEDVDKH